MIGDAKIIDKVCMLRQQGLTIPQIAHAVSRDNPNYFKTNRKQKNISGPDVLCIIEHLKAERRLPTTLLDSLKRKIGEKGKKVEVKKPRRRKAANRPPEFFQGPM